MAAMAVSAENEWEVRPGGMLVQKRTPDSESALSFAAAPVPTIRVKVKYESSYYEIYLSSQSTFGELKKLLAERTGLHPEEQKILYKDKERQDREFLDVFGVRDKSKLVMVADPVARAKHALEARRAAKLERAAKAVKDVGAEVDRLALQVSNVEAIISKGKKVADNDLLSLTEQLMTQMIKLDGITADGDLKLQRGAQARRIRKYVEKLDVLKIKNAKITTTSMSSQQQDLHLKTQQQQKSQASPIVVTTEWEMFDSLTSTSTANSSIVPPTRSNWDLL